MRETTSSTMPTSSASVSTTAQRDARETLLVRAVLLGTFVLSVFHYTDNYTRFDRYAVNPDSLVNEPVLIVLAWVVFTVIGALGYRAYRRQRWWPAVVLLAVYSLTGLISIAHYMDGSPSLFDAYQNFLIVTDIVAGVAVLGLAVWLMRRRALPSLSHD